ncbi:class I SAM-dependent methyltransferase [Lutimonas saemankumensis]|uniref:class I SAM-dependent methyltransferase n=1 Tax=Lutimonas saemankumensis TaxID=483016 RepID=UPI001CD48173|nr:methyltransferase domain-containing protein [Lutimonas saemankumensis]MCA0930988.1 class I SAM-dependent methyltransferase [Lutimonas saemankumensis]
MKTNLKDVFGQAIKDYFDGKEAIIKTYSSVGGWDELPVSYLFRNYQDMPEIEQTALKMSFGKVLDLGCGAGSHSLYLQNKGLHVKPIDISSGAIFTCKQRGLAQAEVMDFWDLKNEKFDTILSLMNGAGICGSMDNVPGFLEHLRSLLSSNGQILIDSSDIIYMFEDENGITEIPELDNYYGEVIFESEYKGVRSGAYPWLYIDFYNLQHQASLQNMKCEMLVQGPHYDFLARITSI